MAVRMMEKRREDGIHHTENLFRVRCGRVTNFYVIIDGKYDYKYKKKTYKS